MKRFKKFLNTPLGSWFKVFASAVLGAFLLQGADIFSLTIKHLRDFLALGFASVLPIILNALNDQDHRYGAGKEEEA